MRQTLRLLVLLLLLSFAASACAESFTIYLPSPKDKSLLPFRATTENGRLNLEQLAPTSFGFAANAVIAHPDKPLLYVSASWGKPEQLKAATVFLNADGSVDRVVETAVNHGYCYLSLDRNERFLMGVDYGSGCVDVIALNDDATIGKRVAGLDDGRKEAHCVWPSPDNRFVYVPYVKKNNALYQYAFDDKTGTLTPLPSLNVEPPANTGPRHLQYHPRKPIAYFSNEQGGFGISAYDRQPDGQLKLRQVVDVDDNPPQEGTSASDLVLSPNGRFLFSGIRDFKNDYNWIARWQILDSGDVKLLGRTPTPKVPWGLAVSPDGNYLAVTAFVGAELSVYAIDENGTLSKAATAPIPKNVMDVVIR